MRSAKDIEKIVQDGKPNLKTGDQLDKLIIDGSHSIMNESRSISPELSIFTLLLRNKIAIRIITAAMRPIAILFRYRPHRGCNNPDSGIPFIAT